MTGTLSEDVGKWSLTSSWKKLRVNSTVISKSKKTIIHLKQAIDKFKSESACFRLII